MSLEQLIEQCEDAWNAFVGGDSEPAKALFSRGNDVTLANPLAAAGVRVGPSLADARGGGRSIQGR